MELDFDKIEQYNRDYKKWLREFPLRCYDCENSECASFAHILCKRASADGYDTGKVSTFGSEREAGRNVSAFRPLADGSGFEKAVWDYHIACAIEVPVYKDSAKTEILVADPVLFGSSLATLKQWAAALDTSLPQVTVQKDYPVDKETDLRAEQRIQALCDLIRRKEAGGRFTLKRFRPLKSTLERSLSCFKPQRTTVRREAHGLG